MLVLYRWMWELLIFENELLGKHFASNLWLFVERSRINQAIWFSFRRENRNWMVWWFALYWIHKLQSYLRRTILNVGYFLGVLLWSSIIGSDLDAALWVVIIFGLLKLFICVDTTYSFLWRDRLCMSGRSKVKVKMKLWKETIMSRRWFSLIVQNL